MVIWRPFTQECSVSVSSAGLLTLLCGSHRLAGHPGSCAEACQVGCRAGEAGPQVVDLLKKNPAVAVPVILARLKQKDEEWCARPLPPWSCSGVESHLCSGRQPSAYSQSG